MADQTLLTLIDEVRGKTLRLLEGVGDAEGHFAAPGLKNTILWHAGHAYMLGETLVIGAATGRRSSTPPRWYETFSWDSDPAAVTDWPAIDEVVQRLRDQRQRLKQVVASVSDEQLDRPTGYPPGGRTVRWWILHGLHDEASHQGEIWLLRKMYAGRTRMAKHE